MPYDKPELRSGEGYSGCVGEDGRGEAAAQGVAAVKVERRGWWRRRWSPITAPDGEGDGGPPAAVRRGLGARGGAGLSASGSPKPAGARGAGTRTHGRGEAGERAG